MSTISLIYSFSSLRVQLQPGKPQSEVSKRPPHTIRCSKAHGVLYYCKNNRPPKVRAIAGSALTISLNRICRQNTCQTIVYFCGSSCQSRSSTIRSTAITTDQICSGGSGCSGAAAVGGGISRSWWLAGSGRQQCVFGDFVVSDITAFNGCRRSGKHAYKCHVCRVEQ